MAEESSSPPPAPPTPSQTAARTLLALVLGQLGLHSVMAGLRMAASLQALREGYSPLAVGLLLALFAAAPVMTAMAAGRFADHWGYHRPVYLAVGSTVIGALLAVGSTWVEGHGHFVMLCLAAMATGAGANTGMLTIQRTAGLAAVSNTDRVRVFSWLGVAPSFSNVVGPVAAGFVIDAAGFRAAYLFLLALPLVTLWSARVVPRRAPTPPKAEHRNRRSWDLLNTPGLRRLLVVNWLLSACWDVHIFAVPLLGHERGFSAGTIGLILGAFTLSVTLVRLVIPMLAHAMKELTVMRWAMLATGAIFAVYPLAPNPALMGLCALCLGVSLGSVQPMLLSTLHQITPAGRHGETLALRSMLMNGSSTAMPLLFGATGAVVGAAALFWVVGAAVGAGSMQVPGLARWLTSEPDAGR